MLRKKIKCRYLEQYENTIGVFQCTTRHCNAKKKCGFGEQKPGHCSLNELTITNKINEIMSRNQGKLDRTRNFDISVFV